MVGVGRRLRHSKNHRAHDQFLYRHGYGETLLSRDARVQANVLVHHTVPRSFWYQQGTARTDPGSHPERCRGAIQQGKLHLETREWQRFVPRSGRSNLSLHEWQAEARTRLERVRLAASGLRSNERKCSSYTRICRCMNIPFTWYTITEEGRSFLCRFV